MRELVAKVGNREIKTRLHVHSWPDPERGEWRGGPMGDGYLDGPLEDMEFLKENGTDELSLWDEEGELAEHLSGVVWQEVQFTWDQDEYKHGIVHIEWSEG